MSTAKGKPKNPPAMKGQEARDLSRREFARRAALAAAGVAALPSALLSQPGTAMVPPRPFQQPGTAPQLPPEALAEVEERYQLILRKYGSRLSDDEKADLRRIVTEFQKPLLALRAYPLDNSDGPATILKLYPPSGRTPRRGVPRSRTKR